MNTTEAPITAITVRGFKSIYDELRMEVRPLTILAGANNSGKSSMMQPSLLLKQTLETPFDPGVISLSGPNVRFTSADQLLSRISGKPEVPSFIVGLEKGDRLKVKLTYDRIEGQGFDIASTEFWDGETFGRITANLTHEEILQMLRISFGKLHQEFPLGLPKSHWQWIVHRERCFLALALVQQGIPDWKVAFGPAPLTPSSIFISEIEGIIHVPGLRGNPERTYSRTTLGGPKFPGTFENYVASVVSQWQTAGEAGLEQLSKDLEELGLTSKVDTRSVDDTRVQLRVARLPHECGGSANEMVNIADVGFGVSQVLPVLVALLVARPGQIVYLEQPEIHLHPLARRRLARIVAAAAKRGVIVVLETHSAHLLREVQTLVAKGELEPDLVKLNWFKRNPADGITELISADLDADGAFGEWPEDFDEINLAAEKDYLDAVEANASRS